MRDQASRLRELMRSAEPDAGRADALSSRPGPDQVGREERGELIRPRVLAISSGKGGVGKSMVAANIAYCMARAGRRVLLIDADLGMANLDLMLGLTPTRTLAHVVSGQIAPGEAVMEGPGGLLFLPGASGLSRVAALDQFERGRLLDDLLEVEEDAELIIIDTGAGISPNVTAFASAADELMVVTTPEPTAVTDAYALIKVLSRAGYDGRIGVLVNQAADRAEGQAVYGRLAKTCVRFLGRSIVHLGYLPRDGHVPAAIRARRPIVAARPAAPASRALVALAAKLLDDAAGVHRANRARRGLFRKIAGLFF